jgi:hypothetical protein
LLGRRVAGADLVREYLGVARRRVIDAAHGRLRFRPIFSPVYTPPPDAPLTTTPRHFRYAGNSSALAPTARVS